MKAKLAVGDRVFVSEQRHSGRCVYTPATVDEVARVYCRVKIDGAPYSMSQRFDAVTGAGEWPSSKGGMCPLTLLRPEEHERIMAERAARMAAEVAAEQAATEKLHALGIELLSGRRACITATTLLATVERYGATP